MKRLELIIVQFEEVKRLIEVERVPQLRLAYILLDSAVELIMHRMTEAEFHHERYNFEQLENLRRLEAWRQSDDPLKRRFATGPSDDQLRADIQRLEKTVTSKSKRKKINDNFRSTTTSGQDRLSSRAGEASGEARASPEEAARLPERDVPP